jgi:hypothetical protein
LPASPQSRNRKPLGSQYSKAKTVENFDNVLQSQSSNVSIGNFAGNSGTGTPLGGPIPETIDKDLLANGISEKDLEIEHLVTQVVALTEKADVIEDMRKDVAANKQMLNDSEQKREGLQVDLADASEKIKKASTEGVSQVQGLIEENQSLRSDLEEVRASIGVKE